MSIYEDIQKRLQARRDAPQRGEGAATTALLRAKSGKAGVSSGPRASSIAESVAVGEAEAVAGQQDLQGIQAARAVADRAKALKDQKTEGVDSLAVQGAAAQGQLNTQTQLRAAQRAGADQRAQDNLSAQEQKQAQEIASKASIFLADLTSNKKVTEDEIFSKYSQGKQELGQGKYAHELSMIVQAEALANEKYIQKIQQAGSLARLEDAMQFKSEIQRLTLGDRMSLIMQQQGWQASYNRNARAFAEDMNSMDLNTALQVSDTLIAGQTAAAVISGGADLYSATYEPSKTETTTTPKKDGG